jgi:endonuclease/exonuclease/phosphatase family metal-dependent hydrolase
MLAHRPGSNQPSPVRSPTVTETLRVATWNLWWRHGDLDARSPAILETLRRIGADVIGLQEVCSREPDQVGWLGDELGLHVVAAPGGEDDRFTIVNAIASRWPIHESGWRYLDVGDMPKHRTVLWARIDTPHGPWDVFTTHLSHGFGQSALRSRQLDEIAHWVEERRNHDRDALLPPVLTGDLNAVPDSDEIRRLTGRAAPAIDRLVFSDVWELVGDGPGETYSEANPYVVDSAWPERRLDYVMVSWPRRRPNGNPIRASRFGLEPIGGVIGSDHWGVMAELAVSPVAPDR